MNTVTVSRTISGPPAAVQEAMLELELAVVDGPEADLAYEQRDGIFEEMWTTFEATPAEDARAPESVEVVATTQFSLDVALIGDFLDATVISRQRRKELNAQLNYLEDVAGH